VRLLLRAPGIDVNRADDEGRTPLWCASDECRLDVVELLLGMPGIDVNQGDEDGRTPLHAAANHGESEVVELLLRAPGVHVFRTAKDGQSAMHFAASCGNTEALGLLVEVVDIKRTFGALLLAMAHFGFPKAEAALLAMHGLPSDRAKALATRMRDTWPAA